MIKTQSWCYKLSFKAKESTEPLKYIWVNTNMVAVLKFKMATATRTVFSQYIWGWGVQWDN